jgi:hemerythrin-like domain-containing protein
MNQAIDTLMHEHRVIEKVLGALLAFAGRLEQSGGEERATLIEFAEFFQNFADKCHHGKEEDRLFAEMIRHGFPKEQGPLAVMVHEHDQGREHVRALAKLGGGTGPLTAEEIASAVQHARDFAALLSAHIIKEDTVLYPMSGRVLTALDYERLAGEFETFEKEVMGEGEHERYHQLADRLIERFGETKIAGHADHGGCHHG